MGECSDSEERMMNVIQTNMMGLVFIAVTSAAISIFSIAYSLQRIRTAIEDLVKEISRWRKEGRP